MFLTYLLQAQLEKDEGTSTGRRQCSVLYDALGLTKRKSIK